MSYEPDRYGSHHREELKKSMEKPFVPYNRRQKPRRDEYDVMSIVVGSFLVVLVVLVVCAQIKMRFVP